MPFRSVSDCRVGRNECALLAMTNLAGFAEKQNGFQNEKFQILAERYRAKSPQKRPFLNKNAPILCHCEERSDVAIFKPKARHPAPKHGSGKRRNSKILIRPGGTPPRYFSQSSISRGRKPVFPVRSIFPLLKAQISLQSRVGRKNARLRSLHPQARSVFSERFHYRAAP